MEALGGDADTLVMFAGSGCTGAIDELIGILELFNYFTSEPLFSYLIDAVLLIAGQGSLRPYRFDSANGLWRHHEGPFGRPLRAPSHQLRRHRAMRYPRNHDRARGLDLSATFRTLPRCSPLANRQFIRPEAS